LGIGYYAFFSIDSELNWTELTNSEALNTQYIDIIVLSFNMPRNIELIIELSKTNAALIILDIMLLTNYWINQT